MASACLADEHLTYSRRSPLVDRDRLVQNHLLLVRRIAWHVHSRVSSMIDIEDLVQCGMIALIDAAAAYEDQGYSFSTYASLRIRGAMIDQMRRDARMCRSAMASKKLIEKSRRGLESRIGRTADASEIAKELGMPIASYHALLSSTESFREESLDMVYSDQMAWFVDPADRADTIVETGQIKVALAQGLSELEEREAMVLQLYFTEDLNLEEIGRILKIGAARVCQIKKSALDKMRLLVPHLKPN